MRSKVIFLAILLLCSVSAIFGAPRLYLKYQAFTDKQNQQTKRIDMAERSGMVMSQNIRDTRAEVSQLGAEIKSDLKDMRAEQRQSMTEMQSSLQQTLDKAVSALQADIKKQELTADGLQKQLEGVEAGLKRLENTAEAESKANAELRKKTRFSMLLMAEQRIPDEQAAIPKPFSYYEGADWQGEMDDFMEAYFAPAQEKYKVYDGHGGIDTFMRKEGGKFDLNGLRYRSYEIYQFNNERPNEIFIWAPGFRKLEDGMLQIDADVDVDTVTLDGCIKWKAAKGSQNYALWKGTDTEGVTKFVKVTPGVPVNVAKKCSTKYLLKAKEELVVRLWSADGLADNGFINLYNHRAVQKKIAHEGFSTLELPDISGEIRQRKGGNCAFDESIFPDDFVVFAAGDYYGRKLGFQIDDSNNEAQQIDVIVNDTEKPVALMLGSYDPTVWNIRVTKGTRIFAMLVGGYYRQILTGVDESDIPTLKNIYKTQREDARTSCDSYYISIGGDAPKLNKISREMFGQPISMTFPSVNGKVIAGVALKQDDKLLPAHGAAAETYRNANAPLSGQAGIDEALKKGTLRPATRADIEAWNKAYITSGAPLLDMPPVAGESEGPRYPDYFDPIKIDNAYVIAEGFVFPAGLYGANAPSFIIPKDLKMPKGSNGHYKVYDMKHPDCYPMNHPKICRRQGGM